MYKATIWTTYYKPRVRQLLSDHCFAAVRTACWQGRIGKTLAQQLTRIAGADNVAEDAKQGQTVDIKPTPTEAAATQAKS